MQIEGVSYVKSFRTDFGSEIQQKGLDPVIQRLEQQVASGTVQKPTAKPGSTSKRRPSRSSERDGRKPGPARIARRRALSRQRRARRAHSGRSSGAERVALRAVQGASTSICGGVGESDSAGLALLIEWLRLARQRAKTIHFANVPAQIEALARISEVEDLIGAASRSEGKQDAMKESG